MKSGAAIVGFGQRQQLVAGIRNKPALLSVGGLKFVKHRIQGLGKAMNFIIRYRNFNPFTEPAGVNAGNLATWIWAQS